MRQLIAEARACVRRYMAALGEVAEAEFAAVAAMVEISAPTLSKQMTMLEQAGYVHVRTGYHGRRPRTWLSLTPAGRDRFTAHLDALRRIAGVDGPRPPRPER